jgi:ABC-type polysaccharide/polyol phosphate transport system ATPase subunit
MSRIAIRTESLGKRYRIGTHAGSVTLRERLTNACRAPLRWFHSHGANPHAAGPRHIWALRDFSFEMREGEVLGLIGRNGAGKTTLLKILSRVTQPTQGTAEIHGRVGSLLEVGTGFHPELTGRENTYLNGAILGMGKKEIDRKFDEIVAFAEVADFIDTPLKHYSTGMQMRLAFAVAAHFEPQILLVDEVLAVGDLAFQKKCLGKMDEVAGAGRTIVFVTHQMNQIRRLCDNVIWMDAGTARQAGPTSEVVGAYESAILSGARSDRSLQDSPATKTHFVSWEVLEPRADRPHVIETPGPVTLRFVVDVKSPVRHAHHGIGLYDADRRLLWGTAWEQFRVEEGVQQFVYHLPDLPVKPGAYSWRVSLYDGQDTVDVWECVPELLVATKPVTHWLDEWAGILNIPSEFHVSPFDAERITQERE